MKTKHSTEKLILCLNKRDNYGCDTVPVILGGASASRKLGRALLPPENLKDDVKKLKLEELD